MKALSIQQPWAELILRGDKDIENRSRCTSVRGIIAIHASKTVDIEACAKYGIDPSSLVTGAIVGSVEITDCVYGVFASKSRWATAGQCHYLLKNPKRFARPIPYRGMPGFFHVKIRTENNSD